MSALDLSRLHTNQRLFVQELMRRGASVFPYDYDMEILLVSYNQKTSWLVDRNTQHVSFTATVLTADKQLSRDIMLAHQLPVAAGKVFPLTARDDIRHYALNILGLPVVIKPHQSSHGDFVFSNIADEEKLEFVLALCENSPDFPSPLIVEKHIVGEEHRIFITTKGDYAVTHRDPAHVVGDGAADIETLAARETKRRLILKKEKNTSLCAIVIDAETEDFLKRAGLSLRAVPRMGEKIYLRHASNLVKGGFSSDRTDMTHPSVIEIAKKTLACFPGLPCAGIDFITPDITCDQSMVTHGVIEVNSNPGFAMHMLPGAGTPRNVAAYAADVLLPDLPAP